MIRQGMFSVFATSFALVLLAPTTRSAHAEPSVSPRSASSEHASPRSSEARAEPGAASSDEDVDRVALAALMLRDGHVDRAAALLREVDPDHDVLDKAEYYRLLGIIALKQHRDADAVEPLRKALAAGDQEPRTILLLAQAEYTSKRITEASATLKAAPESVRALPEYYLLAALVAYEEKDKPRAYDVLTEGLSRFPGHHELLERRVFLLIDLALYQTAIEQAAPLLDSDDATADQFITLATALRRAHQEERATNILERACLRFPDDVSLKKELALSYLKRTRPLTAAEILSSAAMVEPGLSLQVAELYRQARHFGRAVRMNARVEDQVAKARQRLSFLIEQDHYEAAASMDARLARLGLLDDEAVKYALAYAHFKTRGFARAEALLFGLKDPELFKKANALLRAMDTCRKADAPCE